MMDKPNLQHSDDENSSQRNSLDLKQSDDFQNPSLNNCCNAITDVINNISNQNLADKLSEVIDSLEVFQLQHKSNQSSTENTETQTELDHSLSKSQDKIGIDTPRNLQEETLNSVISEYEKTISKLIREKGDLVKERDVLQEHLSNTEAAFSDLHKKYERAKGVIEAFKNNETILKDSVRLHEEQVAKQTNKYEALKTHAKTQLEKANSELLEIKKKYENEVMRLNAIVKKLEIKNSSMEYGLEQKTKECQELTTICDNLIAKLGP